jgi:hypothetical protein
MASPLFKLPQLSFETKSVFTEEQNTIQMITPQTLLYVGLRLSHCQAGRPSVIARGGTSHTDVQGKQMQFVGTINNTKMTTNLYPTT